MIINRSLVNLINEIYNMLLEICVKEPRKSWVKEQIVGIKERMLMIIIMAYPGCDPSPKPADEGRRLACPRKPLIVFRIMSISVRSGKLTSKLSN